MAENRIVRVLTIAGSDSGGGAGIEADLKTFAALGVYGMAAVTAVTAQNTCGVFGVHVLPPETVAQQIDVVAEDIGVDAVAEDIGVGAAKTGMLANAAIIEAVADCLARNAIETLVVDPVMVAKSGDALLEPAARDALIERLVPRAFLLTPNVPEAEVLSGESIADEADLRRAAERIHGLGPRYVLMKGGHLDTRDAVDHLFDGETFQAFTAPRIDTPNTHGTGCTFSAALAAYLGQGTDVAEAVRRAKAYLTEAIRRSLPLGRGHGPVHHGWPRQPP